MPMHLWTPGATMNASQTTLLHAEHDLLERNRRFYDGLWSGARLTEPQRFNTWPLVSRLTSDATHRLEVAPGLRPRFPLHGTHFVDISAPALQRLQAQRKVRRLH